MHRRAIRLSVALSAPLCLAGHLYAQAYDAHSDALLAAYAEAVSVEDIDGNAVITDLDFSVWVMNRVLDQPIPDADCNGTLNAADAIIAVSRELAGLTADFDGSALVD